MAAPTATYPMDGPFYCPRCGYDQRGQPVDGNCPECGAAGVSLEASIINRWADHAMVDLWAVAVLQAVGVGFVLAGYGTMAAGDFAGGILMSFSLMVTLGASGAFAVILIRYALRRCRPNFRNLMPWRRRQLRRWLTLDLALVLVPPAIWLVRRIV